MSEFEIGDVVDVSDGGFPENFSGRGVVQGFGQYGGVLVKLPGRALIDYPEQRVSRPKFVNVVTQKTVWVTLPGDNAGHKLSNDDALTLLRQLEEALS